ncbi:hypothetical protein VTN00DRAFT_6387 [Thermoascus crustaceus]|uniref:uncharacterized protein n=1 Tax=Thermoascus crustaceus TaxID=5088 RepID=UPI003744432E
MSTRRPSLFPLRRFSSPLRLQPSRRAFSTPPQPSSSHDSRLRRLNDRLPKFLRPYTAPLLGAPVSHIASFLILHEITAVVPLFGLVAAFHYGGWMPDLTTGDGDGAFDEGVRRFGRWLRKKGWVDDTDVESVGAGGESTRTTIGTTAAERKGVRLVLEFATAYAITKALLPVRIIASVSATPWFARVVVGPVGRGVRGLFGSK